MPHLKIFGVTPALTLAAVLSVAFFDGEHSGAVAGIAGGFILDALGSTGLMLLPIIYMLIGFSVGLATHRFLSRNFPSFCVFAAIGLLANALGTLLLAIASNPLGDFAFGTAMIYVVLPELGVSALFAMIYYPLGALCLKPLALKL